MKIKYLTRTSSCSELNEFLFGSLRELESSAASYTFLLTGGEHLLYGTCVCAYDFVYPLDGGSPRRRLSKQSKMAVAPRYYCLLSRFPFFRLHFEVIYAILAKLRELQIELEYGDKGVHPHSDSHHLCDDVTSILSETLEAYHNVPVPKLGDRRNNYSFSLPNDVRQFSFTCPVGSEDRLIAEWSLAALFRLISVDSIISLFAACLLEQQVIVVCNNPGILSAVVMSIIPCMRPFVIQGAFIPILPHRYQMAIDAPVPFVIGVMEVLPEFKHSLQNAVVLYVKEDKVVFPSSFSSRILIERAHLKKKLQECREKIVKEVSYKRKWRFPFQCTDEEKRVVKEILKAFYGYLSIVLKRFAKATECLKGFDFADSEHLERAIANLPKRERSFYEALTSSQMFACYSDVLSQVVAKRKRKAKELLKELDQLIKNETSRNQLYSKRSTRN